VNLVSGEGPEVLELAILGLLCEQEFHGYEIRRRLRDELGLFVNISFGSLYPALSRLEKAGAVVATESSATSSPVPIPLTGSLSGERAAQRSRRAGSTRGTKRSRKVYRITPEGRTLFEQLLAAEEPVGTDEARSFGLRLAFARHLAPQARLGLLERRREQLARRLAADRARSAAGDDFDSYTRSLVEHSTETTEHELSWLDRLIESERQIQTASVPDRSGTRTVGTAATLKGTEQ
jgi:DNA-binding PadR family transcriptional regulator